MIGCHVSILSNLLKFVYFYSNSYDSSTILTINLYFKVKIKYLEVLGKNKEPYIKTQLARRANLKNKKVFEINLYNRKTKHYRRIRVEKKMYWDFILFHGAVSTKVRQP